MIRDCSIGSNSIRPAWNELGAVTTLVTMAGNINLPVIGGRCQHDHPFLPRMQFFFVADFRHHSFARVVRFSFYPRSKKRTKRKMWRQSFAQHIRWPGDIHTVNVLTSLNPLSARVPAIRKRMKISQSGI